MGAQESPQLRTMASLKKHSPARKLSAKYSTRPPKGLPEFEMLKSSHPVTIAVTETRPSTGDSSHKTSEENAPTEGRSSSRPRRPTITIPTKAIVANQQSTTNNQPLPPPPSHPPPNQIHSRAPSPAEVALPRSSTDTPDLVQSDSRATTAVPPSAQTPVMRSMFPGYNTTVSLTQQDYVPNPEVVPALTRMREVTRPSSFTPPLHHASSNTSLAPPSQAAVKKESPLRRSESLKRPAVYSTPGELLGLWNVANGQAFDDEIERKTLELSCDDLALNKEIITFSSTSHCLYALSAAQPDQISTTRVHPQDSRTKIPICTTTLNRPSRQDPLIACIFPKLAGLMALDKSSTAAIEQGLDRQTSALLQADAINKAQEKEGSMLLWDYDSNRFCIMHPTLLDDSATTMRIDITPTPTSPETITIFAPETDTPLLELEMTTLALRVHGSVIAALPSLYILDTLMTALLILLLHLHRSCADPANRHSPQQQQQTAPSQQSRTSYDMITDDPSSSLYFPPPPPSLHSQASKRDLRRPTSSRLSAFRSVRSVKSSRSLAPSLGSTRYGDTYDKDIELGDLDPHTGLASPSSAMASKSKSKPSNRKQKAPKGLVDVDDPGLPKGTRAVLRFLYWGFEVLFWVVGTLMQVAAAAVVGAGKFVTKL